MNKQECRNKNKRHYHHRAKQNVLNYTSQPGANENVSESLSKAPEKKSNDKLVLTIGVIISALTMAIIYLSGAK